MPSANLRTTGGMYSFHASHVSTYETYTCGPAMRGWSSSLGRAASQALKVPRLPVLRGPEVGPEVGPEAPVLHAPETPSWRNSPSPTCHKPVVPKGHFLRGCALVSASPAHEASLLSRFEPSVGHVSSARDTHAMIA